MFTEFFLSFKYLKGSKKEFFISFNSLISLLAVLLSIMALIIVISIMEGFSQELRQRIIGIGSHIQIEKFGFENNYLETEKNILAVENIDSVAPFLARQAILARGASFNTVIINGVAEAKINQVSAIEKYINKGMLSLKPDTAIVGSEIAKKMGYDIGSIIEIINPQLGEKKIFTVSGIFNSGMYLYDNNFVFLDFKTAQAFFKQDTVSGFRVKVIDESKIFATKEILKNKLGSNYFVNSWLDLNKNLIGALKTEKKVMFIIMSVMVMLSGFNIASSLFMMVLSKKREIGILKSLGLQRFQVARIFLWQGITIGAVGTSLGTLLGLLFTININLINEILEKIFHLKILPKDIYYLDKIPFAIDYSNIVIIISFGFLSAILASLYPAFKASKLEPVEVLKNV